jgi:hypothetical protein
MNTQQQIKTPQVARGETKLAADLNSPARNTDDFRSADFITSKEMLRRYPFGCRKSLYNHCKAGTIPSIVLKGGRRRYFHIPSVDAALLRFQKGGVQ